MNARAFIIPYPPRSNPDWDRIIPTAMPLSVGTRLGPYEILAPLGAGGMGEVYQARDTRLNRFVAIKVLSADKVTGRRRVKRLIREAQAASALSHPNVVTIYDIGSENGVDFLAMEFVAGKTLSAIIPRQGMPVDQVLNISVQMADALTAAHAAGIIHRDIKPGNVMLTADSRVKLLDFGLAKLLEEPDPDVTRTLEGTVLGTFAYMSPEQVQGRPADTRSDIFSFGAVLYEMFSGHRAFRGRASAATAVLHDEPAPLIGVPSEVVDLVTRCLHKNPSERYPRISEVRSALERIRQAASKPPESEPSIAVLPFANLSADKENEYFGDGLAEEIINALTRLPGMRVAARTSAFQFRGTAQDLRKIADQLKVRTVLEGSVRRAGNRVRVTVQLVNAADGYQMWSERYDREMTDIFVLQDDIAQAIVKKLMAQSDAVAYRPLVRRHSANLRAWQSYWEGRHHQYHFTPARLAQGKEYFERAIAQDPQYAMGYVGLAQHYTIMANLAFAPPREVLPLAHGFVEKALERDETLGDAHAAAGVISVFWKHDWAGAARAFHRALERSPGSSSVHHLYAFWWLRPLGRFEEAIEENAEALALDPLSPFLRVIQADTFCLVHRQEAAVDLCQAALRLDESCYLAYRVLAQTYLDQRRFEEALATCAQSAALTGDSPVERGLLAATYWCAGRRDEARRLLAELRDMARHRHVQASVVGKVHLVLGELEEGWNWVERAVEERDPGILTLAVDPFFDRLRGARYDDLLRRMRLERCGGAVGY